MNDIITMLIITLAFLIALPVYYVSKYLNIKLNQIQEAQRIPAVYEAVLSKKNLTFDTTVSFSAETSAAALEGINLMLDMANQVQEEKKKEPKCFG